MRINLDSVIDNIGFEEYSKKYQAVNNSLKETTKNINELENKIKEKKDINELFQEYMDLDRNSLLLFLARNPLFSQYVREKVKYDELSYKEKKLLDAFHIDDIQAYRECKHVFGLMHGNYVCINCGINENDLSIINLDELETFKDIVVKKERYAGRILNEEIAYLDLIYEQHLKNNEIKKLKKIQ